MGFCEKFGDGLRDSWEPALRYGLLDPRPIEEVKKDVSDLLHRVYGYLLPNVQRHASAKIIMGMLDYNKDNLDCLHLASCCESMARLTSVCLDKDPVKHNLDDMESDASKVRSIADMYNRIFWDVPVPKHFVEAYEEAHTSYKAGNQ